MNRSNRADTEALSQRARRSEASSRWSMIIAALSLVVSVLTVLNGTGRQGTFESRRQVCLESLTTYSGTMYEILVTQGTVNDNLQGRFRSEAAAAEISCFDGGVLLRESEWFNCWRSNIIFLDTYIGGRDDEFADIDTSPLDPEEFSNVRIRMQIEAINAAFEVVIEADGPALISWFDPSPKVPTAWPSQNSPDPDACQAPVFPPPGESSE